MRILTAAIVAPITLPVIVEPVMILYSGQVPGDLREEFAVAGFIVAIAYVAMFLIGLPSYLLLRSRKLASIWTAALVGFLAANLAVFAFVAVGGFGNAIQNEAYAWKEPLKALRSTAFAGVQGVLVAVIFWVIATSGRKTQPSN